MITIIAILASLLLPALRTAKEKGRSVVCLSNLRQKTLGWKLAIADDGDCISDPNIPGSQPQLYAGTAQGQWWMTQWGRSGSASICPSAPDRGAPPAQRGAASGIDVTGCKSFRGSVDSAWVLEGAPYNMKWWNSPDQPSRRTGSYLHNMFIRVRLGSRMPAFDQKTRQIPPVLARPSRLPIVAFGSVLLLIAAGWLFFLATFELSKVNYGRKGGADGYKATRTQQKAAKPAP